MKKVFTLVCTLFLGAALSFAQTGGGTTGTPSQDAGKTTTTKGKKHHHKGGKKHKKGDGANTGTTPPK